MNTVVAFRQVPPFAEGIARDLRLRWALEEAGLPYELEQVSLEDTRTPAYRRRQPFGQTPIFETPDVTLFESGAIVLHIGAHSEALLPAEPAARARAITWVFAALNTVENPIGQLAQIDLANSTEEWARLRRPGAEQAVRKRLDELATWLDGKEFLEERFTAGDLMMTTVLRILRHTDLVTRMPVLDAYVKRCEARPAFGRALDAHLAAFARNRQ
ncbi:glutathione S-transferase [Pseudoduganella flava]|uniref:Glutathione S-transferase n=1 Tax=Pseudoduganella flava TaxID=871742 RepID=A0A562Q522_9BURK|nr:glutathione S-transferase family protein [Pseudoduganella flava]QGZ41823.1 glutathione S-transferase family protein [Pseudoduganella flava]TWI51833.1 glutathione S-transferase [Pseudoduganella flava]